MVTRFQRTNKNAQTCQQRSTALKSVNTICLVLHKWWAILILPRSTVSKKQLLIPKPRVASFSARLFGGKHKNLEWQQNLDWDQIKNPENRWNFFYCDPNPKWRHVIQDSENFYEPFFQITFVKNIMGSSSQLCWLPRSRTNKKLLDEKSSKALGFPY